MLSTWMNNFMTTGGVPIGAPEIFSNDGTNQGAVLTVSAGATLYRDGIAKTAPYTTTADDALATFWAADASDTEASRSASILIASSAPAPTTYDGILAVVKTFENGSSVSGDFLNITEFSVQSPSNVEIPHSTDTCTYAPTSGTIAQLSDGNTGGQVLFPTGHANIPITRMFNAATALESCRVGFATTNAKGPGSTDFYGINGVTPTASPILSITAPNGYVGTAIKYFTIGTAALAISGTFAYSTADITVTTVGVTGTGRVRVLDYTDASYPIELADWATVANGGTISATTQADYRLLLQDSAIPSNVVASAATIAVMGQSTPNNTLGMNFNLMAAYYGADEPRNLADKCAIYWSTGGVTSDRTGVTGATVVFDTYGNPIGPIPAGMTTLVYHIFESCPNLGRHGSHTATILNGSGTLRFSTATVINITLGAITATTAAFTVPASGTGITDLYIMVDSPTMPADGFKLLVTKDSDGLTYPDAALSPQAVRDYEATQFGVRGLFLRDLHISGVEDGNNPPSDFGYKSRPEFAARACNQTGANWWHASHWAESDATRLDWVQRWKATASPTAILWGEYLNELWNTYYSNQQNSVITLGINAGFMPAYQPPVGVTVYNGTSWTDPTSGILNRSVAAGTVFWCYTFQSGQTPTSNGYYRWTLTKCLTGASSGDTVPFSGTNSQWQTIVSNDSTGFFRAMYKYQASVQKQIGIMGRAELGSRFKSVIGATQNTFLEPVSYLTDALVLDDNYKYIDYYAMDGYVGGITYNATTWPWMATPTDLTAFKDGFFAMIPDMITTIVNTLLDRVDVQFASFIAAGIPAKYAPRPVLYEFGMPRIGSIPSGIQTDFAIAMNAVFADARMRALITPWVTSLFAKFDVLVWHNATQDIIKASEIQFYGLLTRQEEITPPQTHEDYPAYAQAYLGFLDSAPPT